MRFDIAQVWRHAPFGGATGDSDIELMGIDWSGASFAMEVRPEPGGSGGALVDLSTAAAGSQGISAIWDAAYVHPDTGLVVGATVIRIQIDETTLEAVDWGANDPSEPLDLVYDLTVTPLGLPKFVFLFGKFRLYPGVTA
jgi:hypothetical protein